MSKTGFDLKKAGVLTVFAAALAMGAATVRAETGPAVAGGFPMDLADVVEKVGPAVVNIQVAMKGRPVEAGRLPSEEDLPPGLREFFRRYFGEQDPGNERRRAQPPRPGPQQPEVQAQGSGFLIDVEGHVVTNNHVVKDADTITVVLMSGAKLDVTLVGRDERTDLALLKVKSDAALPHLAFGDSDAMRVGNWVFTVGNPFGLGHTVTTGILSARGRSIGAGPYDDFLQLDAPINPGNSGGPAFNLKGEVIGINTAIFSPSGGNVGIGFAIPSSLAQDVIQQLKSQGNVTRGWLGVEIQAVTPEIAESLGLKKAEGALVAKVDNGGPAKAAGVAQGDVILSVNGKDVRGSTQLPRMIASIKPGDRADLKLWRGGKTVQASLRVGTLPERVAQAEPGRPDGGPSIEGMKLSRLDDRSRQAFGFDAEAKGVVVISVADGSVAERQGIVAGDLIATVSNRAVASPEDVVREIAKAKRQKAVLMLVKRAQQERFVALPIGTA